MPVVPLARCEPRKSPHRGAGNLSIDAAKGDDAGYSSRVSHFESIGLVDRSQRALRFLIPFVAVDATIFNHANSQLFTFVSAHFNWRSRQIQERDSISQCRPATKLMMF
jgi:hypothetical protein